MACKTGKNREPKGDNNTLNQDNEVKGHIRYDQDTKRYHRFRIEFEDEDIEGTIYISKQKSPLPIRLILDRVRN